MAAPVDDTSGHALNVNVTGNIICLVLLNTTPITCEGVGTVRDVVGIDIPFQVTAYMHGPLPLLIAMSENVAGNMSSSIGVRGAQISESCADVHTLAQVVPDVE